jgi:hypothetical protein
MTRALIALSITLISITAASAGDHHGGNNGAIVTHPDYGTRIVNDTWERQNQAPSGGPNQAFGMVGGPHENQRHTTVGGSLFEEGGTVPKCSGPAFEGAC